MRRIVGRLLAFAVILGLLVVLCDRLRRERMARRELTEPHVGFVPLGRWLLDHPYSAPDPVIEAILLREGEGVVPILERVAEQGLSPLELRFFYLWQNHLPRPLRRVTGRWITADPGRTDGMMRLLGSLGPEASKAVPTLLRLARIDFMGTGQHARIALLNIAPQDPEVRALELAWLNSNSLEASHYFREAHCTYPEALPILQQKIAADPAGTGNELLALAQYGPAASNALPVVRKLFQAQRANALSVLLAMGPPAAPAAPELAALLGGTENMDLKILDALRRIGPGAAGALPGVTPYLTATNPVTRLLAEATAASLRGEPAAVLPSFRNALGTHRPFGTPYELSFPLLGDTYVYNLGPRQMACWLAGEMGPAAAPILPSLEACFDDERELLRILAAWAHWRIAHQADKVLPVLRAILRDSDSNAQDVAICALTEIGPSAAAAEPELQAIRKTDLKTRRLANLALKEIHRNGH